MKSKIVTTVEQSRKLRELGIDIDTADMWYVPKGDSYKLVTDSSLTRGIIPAWSLSALMNLMPKRFLLIKDSVVEKYHLYTKEYIDTGNHISAETPIDTVFEMICYLKENKLV